MKNKEIRKLHRRSVSRVMGLGLTAVLSLTACNGVTQPADAGEEEEEEEEEDRESDKDKDKDKPEGGSTEVVLESYEHPHLLAGMFSSGEITGVKPTDASITVKPEADLSNVINVDDFYLNEEQKQMLATNGFCVSPYDSRGEFFEGYESNRYNKRPNFVTVDSMMHTYHLYFMHLMKNTEKEYLFDMLDDMSADIYEIALEQADELEGTEWEDSAKLNVEFFAVGLSLLGEDPDLPDYAKDPVADEIALINNASGMCISPIFGGNSPEDYTQYKPRGYYAGDEKLERYFRAMMWYGRSNFNASEEAELRSSILMCLAMDEGAGDTWKKMYEITAFFAGESDDLSYLDYMPAIKTAFGEDAELEDIAEDEDGLDTFADLVNEMRGPVINSVPMWDDGGATDKAAANKGFRFMGQRYSVDGEIFSMLIYSKTGENANGEKRMLPDALDVAAGLGSDRAYEILKEQGDTEFDQYESNMEKVRTGFNEAPDEFWEGSLSLSWIRTIRPLLEEKDDSYPFFMTTDAWQTKSVEGFLASWTELKHDTVLYAKQVIAEMGGDDPEDKDDRGYVEPEVEVFKGLEAMITRTGEGLDAYGCITDSDKDNLTQLADLAGQLAVISEKELTGGSITDDEYELIRSYGGTIEHFWYDAVRDGEEGYIAPEEHPAALVTDVATGDGSVLECGTGNAGWILVLVPVDGELRIAGGTVFSFYEFEWPSSDRLTDDEWCKGMGFQNTFTDDGSFVEAEPLGIEKPAWTMDYRYNVSND